MPTVGYQRHASAVRQVGRRVVLLCMLAGGCRVSDASTQAAQATRNRLASDLRALAGDEAQGRGLAQPGLAGAVEYAADALRDAGTVPGWTPGDAEPRYVQPVPVIWYRYGPGNKAWVTRSSGADTLAHGTDMVLLTPGESVAGVPAAAPAFVGLGVSEPDRGWDDYADVDVNGRWVFVMEGGFSLLPPSLRDEYQDPREGTWRLLDAAVARGVAGVIVVPPEDLFHHWNVLARTRAAGTFTASQPYAGTGPNDVPFPVVTFTRGVLDDLFRGRGYDPITREGRYRSFALPDVTIGLQVDARRLRLRTHNVLGLVRGDDASLADEVVVVSAHIDHLGIIDGEIYNGANDDASGCAVVLELARRIAAVPTRRSVLFALFTAEEADHLGSLHFLENRDSVGGRIVASLNFEHMGRSADGTLLATASESLFDLTAAVAEGPVGGRLRVRQLEAGGGSIRGSDSFSFFLHDVPLVIVGGGGFPEYHSPRDDTELIDLDLLEDGVTLGESLVRRLGGER